MAKRKRLIVPDTAAPDPRAPGVPAPETKAMDIPLGYAPDHMRARAPIADVAGQAAQSAALETVAGEMQAARVEGRLVQKVPLAAVDASHMIRDRMVIDAADMAALEASLKARGQQTPIEVVETAPGRYGLISGWRRVTALRSLARAGEAPDTILALIRAPETASDAYVAMVEENEIRVGLSYFERAAIVVQTVGEGVFRSEKEALNNLFGSASRAKRSKIKSFVPVVKALGPLLTHPAALTERLGLALSARLAEDADWGRRLYDRLRKARSESAEEEASLLHKALKSGGPAAPAPKAQTVGQAAASEQDPVTVTRGRGQLRLSGPGVSEALLDAVEALVRDWRE